MNHFTFIAFGPAYSSDNAGDGPTTNTPHQTSFTNPTTNTLSNICEIIRSVMGGSTTLKEQHDTLKKSSYKIHKLLGY